MAWKHFFKCKSEDHHEAATHSRTPPYTASKANGGFVTHEQTLRILVDRILYTTNDIFQKISIKLASKLTGVKTVKLNHQNQSKLF